MINKQIISQALNDIKLFGIDVYGMSELEELAELYIAEKLVEPVSNERLQNLLYEINYLNLENEKLFEKLEIITSIVSYVLYGIMLLVILAVILSFIF